MVSLALFAILYSFLSVLLIAGWFGLVSLRRGSLPASRTLFTLRVLPFAASAGVALFLAFPSFLLLEAHTMDEDLGTFVLCFCSLVIFVAGFYRLITAHAETRRAVLQWLQLGQSGFPTSSATLPPIMLVGIRAPQVLVSDSARMQLTDGELRAAIRHEIQHLHSADNLKKAILNFLYFPGMSTIERAWQQAAELNADRGAVTDRAEALDLASALVKLSRGTMPPPPALATGLIGVAESVAVRVQRLLEWSNHDPVPPLRWRYILPAACALILGLAVNFGSALLLAHSMTERLVP
jgi:beta-lactamase regulating signal transducer with metallopeptidase domain